MPEIRLPYEWKPRAYQVDAWRYLSMGGLRAVLCWPRRSGKDECLLHHVACAAHERVGTYWYMLPEYGQARKSMWDALNPKTGRRRIDDAFPAELRRNMSEQEMQIEFHNGSTFQLVGSDNFDSLVGSPPVGLVFSEYALSNPTSWAYMRPILLENGGWAAFNSTPRGKNHFKDMCDLAQRRMVVGEDGRASTEGWFFSKLTNDDTQVFSPFQLQEELEDYQKIHGDEYGRALWLQEYFTSFDAAVPGAIFGGAMTKAQEAGRIGVVAIDRTAPVHTAWDLGRTDMTAVWWFQVFAGVPRVVGFHNSSLKDVPFYANVIDEWRGKHGVTMGTNYLPHDARPRTLASPRSILQQLQEENAKRGKRLGKFVIAPRLDKQEQIQAGRATIAAAMFDAERCAAGIEALKQYKFEWDDEAKVFSPTPDHNWASHPADAWMILSLCWKAAKLQSQEDGGSVAVSEVADRSRRGALTLGAGASFAALRDQHLRRKRAARNPLFGRES